MSCLTEDVKLLKNNNMWDKVNNSIKKVFDSKSIYNEKTSEN